jgi:hypothetical protein
MLAPLAFLGLPSLHSIIEGIAKGFIGALAHALVPSWLAHGTVATIQYLVALPDPASWTHVSELQGDMIYLAAMLLPLTLAVSSLRYWLVGLTGAAHPAGAIGRCAAVTSVLVAYRWFVEQAVAATNTLTHAILGFPVVAGGLLRIVGVLFGGALLTGAGGVFGAVLVIVGVFFAAGLFAAQVLVTVLLAVLIVAGPPLIAISAIPELSHLARSWARALVAVALVPLGWSVLFATAGALCVDATSFTGGAGGVPGHVAAAFAGLITFALAIKLPLMLLGELRHLLGGFGFTSPGGASAQSTMPGAQRVRAAHARLRSAAFEGAPALGRSAGRAAGAPGVPAGGPLGAARRGLAGAARRSGVLPAATATGKAGRSRAGAARRAGARGAPGGVRERLRNAGMILANAPRGARSAMTRAPRKARRTGGVRPGQPVVADPSDRARQSSTQRAREARKGTIGASRPEGTRPRGVTGAGRASVKKTPPPRDSTARGAQPQTRTTSSTHPGGHPGRRVETDAARKATGMSAQTRPPRASKRHAKASPKPAPKAPPPRRARRKPRPRSGS